MTYLAPRPVAFNAVLVVVVAVVVVMVVDSDDVARPIVCGLKCRVLSSPHLSGGEGRREINPSSGGPRKQKREVTLMRG